VLDFKNRFIRNLFADEKVKRVLSDNLESLLNERMLQRGVLTSSELNIPGVVITRHRPDKVDCRIEHLLSLSKRIYTLPCVEEDISRVPLVVLQEDCLLSKAVYLTRLSYGF
jgi:hypothetical protein